MKLSKIEINDFQLVENGAGSIIILNNSKVTFTLEHLPLEIEILKNSSKSNNYFELQALDDGKKGLLKLYNFNNFGGSGTTSPIVLSENNNKKLCLHFYIIPFGENGYSFHYTFLETRV